ncbi:MAG: hypothetical protein ABI162_16175 [Luteolibacter sp.]
MSLRNFHVLRIAGLLAISAGILPAADFVAPAEGPVAFRRDKIPLTAETLASLSKDLETLATAHDPATAVGRRGIAQMLALATALDPSNSSARELIAQFEKGTPPPKPDASEVGKGLTEIWQLLGWLESPEAGGQGRALAACLADIVVLADPKQAPEKPKERGAWAGWVPALSAYEKKVVAKVETKIPPAKTKVPEITLPSAHVTTMLWQKGGTEEAPKWVLGAAPIDMIVKKATDPEDPEQPADFSLTIRTAPSISGLPQIAASIKALLKKQHGTLPVGRAVVISSEQLQKSVLSNKRQSISAAVAVLASAGVTGREPDGTIIGLVDQSGAFTLPTNFWDQLVALGKGNGGRLVLPAAAADYLPSLLALEQPQFFLEHEVVLASNFQELLELSAKNPPDAVAKASAKFQEIREKGASQAVGQYVANPFIRRRLAELSSEAPNLYSARMLVIQGAGNRPTQLPRVVLAAELRRAIEPMAWISAQQITSSTLLDSATIDRIGQTFEACRVQVDRLDRYTQKDDRELFGRVKELIATLRPLERAARGRSDEFTGKDSLTPARTALLRAYAAVMEELSETPKEPAESGATP